jgi:hypothetical protein
MTKKIVKKSDFLPPPPKTKGLFNISLMLFKSEGERGNFDFFISFIFLKII